VQLNFNHPIIELIWAVRRNLQDQCNNHFNYCGKYGLDAVRGTALRLNNLGRFGLRDPIYLRCVQPWQHHTLIPDSFIYSYSFALFPEDSAPSGSCNFSRIDNVELIVDVQQEIQDEEVTLLVFGRNWNILRFRDGLAGLLFIS
jgi:hypothetical protein